MSERLQVWLERGDDKGRALQQENDIDGFVYTNSLSNTYNFGSQDRRYLSPK